MREKLSLGFKILILFAVLPGFSFQLSDTDVSEHPRKIVVFKKRFRKKIAQDILLKNSGAVKIKHLKLTNSTAVRLSRHAEKVLRKKDEILRIDEDIVIHALGEKAKSKKKRSQPPQELTWGIDRIEADLAWSKTGGSKIKVAILDTGIDLDHPDLRDNIKGDVNMIKPRNSGDDDSGHGTHVAGVIAAVDNKIGVIGTGPEISLYAVKVLDKKGDGWLSDLIDALDWCIDNEMQVINMCFGSPNDNQSFHDAIIRVNLAGITQVASAGNNGEYDGLIEYPAKYPQTIAVSAVDRDGEFASFSSYGSMIDLTAPGVNIKSTYKKGSYKIMSGTSMSAPHVTGVVALILKTKVKRYDLDGDKKWDPDEIKSKLRRSAEALGLDPNKQGAGLVRADFAVR
jgi:subtilisin family serine protease